MTKPTKWHVRPAKNQISLGICPVWSESSLSAWRKLGSLATHWMHSEDWSDWQMPRLIWVFAGRMSFCWFCHAAALLLFFWRENKLSPSTNADLSPLGQNSRNVSWPYKDKTAKDHAPFVSLIQCTSPHLGNIANTQNSQKILKSSMKPLSSSSYDHYHCFMIHTVWKQLLWYISFVYACHMWDGIWYLTCINCQDHFNFIFFFFTIRFYGKIISAVLNRINHKVGRKREISRVKIT